MVERHGIEEQRREGLEEERETFSYVRWTGQRETRSSIHYQLFYSSSRVPALGISGPTDSTDLQTHVAVYHSRVQTLSSPVLMSSHEKQTCLSHTYMSSVHTLSSDSLWSSSLTLSSFSQTLLALRSGPEFSQIEHLAFSSD